MSFFPGAAAQFAPGQRISVLPPRKMPFPAVGHRTLVPLSQPPHPAAPVFPPRPPSHTLHRGRGLGKGLASMLRRRAAGPNNGATADQALECLLAVVSRKVGTPLPQIGALLSAKYPGGWNKNFSHLGSLRSFLEVNPYYFHIQPIEPQPLITRCDPVDADAEPQVAEEPAGEPVPYTAEQALNIISSHIPPEQCIQISQVGTLLGPGGWNGNKQYSHLAKNFQTFLLEHPERFAVDTVNLTVQHASNQNGTAARTVTPVVTPRRPTGPKASAIEAAAAILAVIPEVESLPLAQLGTRLGVGGWKTMYGHLGNLRSFIENNPELFTIDVSLVPAGGQPMLARGPRSLEEVMEVNPGSNKVRRPERPSEEPIAKRFAGMQYALPGPVSILPPRLY